MSEKKSEGKQVFVSMVKDEPVITGKKLEKLKKKIPELAKE